MGLSQSFYRCFWDWKHLSWQEVWISLFLYLSFSIHPKPKQWLPF